MLNLTAAVFTSVLGIAGNPLYNVDCVIIVYEQSVPVRVTKKWQLKIKHDWCERVMITIIS